ncbi:MBOAT family O-acyltransferase [Calditrichota bacterium]
MLFNSLDFAVFLPIVFAVYWLLNRRSLRVQNAFLVLASYVFYGWWDWRFLSLILISTVVDYAVGIGLGGQEDKSKRKALLWVSVVVNLGLLGFFKYYNFFLQNFIDAFTLLGLPFEARSLSIVLPIGISFYTFQTMSYSIDVYRRRLAPTRDFIAFAGYVSFFPQLVAGPIERATNLLPQFYERRTFNSESATDGMRQILWGLFKKIVIADNCAIYVDIAFSNSADYSGSSLAMGIVFFAFQIYADFAGYSDIGIGTARLFGFKLKQNFAYPYFSRDVAEFWRRWHISLTSWMTDYLFVPLTRGKRGVTPKVKAYLLMFGLSGLWHGANWTFVTWGIINALYFIPLLVFKQAKYKYRIVAKGKLLPSLEEAGRMLMTFVLVNLAGIFFRADSIGHAVGYLGRIFTMSLFTLPDSPGRQNALITACLIVFFIVVEWLGRENQYAIEKIGLQWSTGLRWSFYAFIVFLIGMYMPTDQTPFIYFQF